MAHHKEQEPSLEPITTATTRRRQRKDDPVFDALARVDKLNPRDLDKTDGSRIGTAAARIRKKTPDVTATEVMRRAGRYRRGWPSVTLTAMGLANNWQRFDTDAESETEPADRPISYGSNIK